MPPTLDDKALEFLNPEQKSLPLGRAERLRQILDEEKAAEAKPAPAAEAKPAPAPEAVPDRIKQSFTRLAEKEAAFRREQDAVKPYMEGLKAFSPGEVAAITKAKASGDPLAVLSAFGFSYADVATRMVDMGAAKKAPPPPEKADSSPEFMEIRKELADLRAERAQRQYDQVVARVSDMTKDKPLISKLKRQGAVLEYLIDFARRTGAPPGETFDESVAIAAEAVEADLVKEAATWRDALGVSSQLTTPPPSVMVAGGEREAPSGQAKTGTQTLTNAAASAPRMESAVKTREERLKALANDPNLW